MVNGQCSNLLGTREWHRHRHLIDGAAKFAAKCPIKLVRAVLRALRDELRQRGHLSGFDEVAGPVPEFPEIPENYREMLEQGGGFWDDVNGGFLPTDLVLQARAEMRTNTAAGNDGCPPEVYRNLPFIVVLHLWKLFAMRFEDFVKS